MAELSDHHLLTDFARTGAENAFAALVTRHVNLVFSTARRFTNDDHLAEEITQAVFIILARKAGGISARVVLTGWLYQTARLTAANALKENIRRQRREQETYMESTLTPNETDEAWKQLAPVLDDAMGALREADRNAVLLRYFENQPLAEVGAVLGVSEDAARVRVNRALEKLRATLTKSGVTLGVTAIAGAVTANAIQAAPIALTATITTAALTGTSLTLATIAMTTLQKIAVTAALTVTLGAGIYQAKQAHDAQNEVQLLKEQQAPMAEQIRLLQSDLSNATNMIAGLNEELMKNQRNNFELLKLRAELSKLKLTPAPNVSNSTPANDNDEKIAATMKQAGELNKKINALYQVEGRLLVFKTRLGLTSEQEAMLREILNQKFVENTIIATWESTNLDSQIAAVLTPEQKLEARKMAAEEWQHTRDGQASVGAKSELDSLRFYLGLNDEQILDALPVLEEYQKKMYQLDDSQGSSPSHRTTYPAWPYSEEITGQELDGLKKILSPEQFEILKNHEHSMLEEQHLLNEANQ